MLLLFLDITCPGPFLDPRRALVDRVGVTMSHLSRTAGAIRTGTLATNAHHGFQRTAGGRGGRRSRLAVTAAAGSRHLVVDVDVIQHMVDSVNSTTIS